MFIESVFVSGLERLEKRVSLRQTDLMKVVGKSDDDYLKEAFPRCVEEYQQRRMVGTTWSVEPSVQAALFHVLKDASWFLDYVFAHADPQANQTLGVEDIQRGVDALAGKSLMDVDRWYMGEGIDKRVEVYER